MSVGRGGKKVLRRKRIVQVSGGRSGNVDSAIHLYNQRC